MGYSPVTKYHGHPSNIPLNPDWLMPFCTALANFLDGKLPGGFADSKKTFKGHTNGKLGSH